jgi:hypothetical protein
MFQVLGDNLFYSHDSTEMVASSRKNVKEESKATVIAIM